MYGYHGNCEVRRPRQESELLSNQIPGSRLSAYNRELQDANPDAQSRCIDLMLAQCWDSVADGGPTLSQHQINVPPMIHFPPMIPL